MRRRHGGPRRRIRSMEFPVHLHGQPRPVSPYQAQTLPMGLGILGTLGLLCSVVDYQYGVYYGV